MLKTLKRLFGIMIIALLLRSVLMENFQVSGKAMLPTMVPGDVLLVWKWAYGVRVPGSGVHIVRWSEIQRGDVVVVQAVGDPPVTLARRVVGLPGEDVRIEKGTVAILTGKHWNAINCSLVRDLDGYCLEKFGETFVTVDHSSLKSQPREASFFKLKESEIFVLSDNRADGPDSRNFGPIRLNSIVGKVKRVSLGADPQSSDLAFPVPLQQQRGDRRWFLPILAKGGGE